MSDKTIVVISDSQIPFEDRKATKALVEFIGEFQPDEVVHIGDLMDYPQPSRWNKDSRGEFEGSIYEDSKACKTRFLDPLREVYSGPIGVHEGNHDERPRVYLEKYAPALAYSPERPFDFDKLLDFEGYQIDRLPEFYKIAPNWITTHGHRGGIRLSPIAGNTALNAAKRFGTSVIMGHTHRLGLLGHTHGYGGYEKRVWGLEVGNLMDMRQAQYLKGGTANWQKGFGVVRVSGQHVQAEAIGIYGGRFVVDGRTYLV